MIASAMNVVLHTPWWVFALFALLLMLGLQALRPRVLPLWRLLLTPAIFIVWGLFSLTLRLTPASPIATAFLGLDWLAAAAAGVVLAWTKVRPASMRVEATGIAVPGSVIPLLRNLLIFVAKYGLTVAAVLVPTQQDNLALLDIAVSGVSAGYFLGWIAHLARIYQRSPRPALAAPRQWRA